MLQTTNQPLPTYTAEQLRGMVATLSKNGVQKIGQSEEILKTISLIASTVVKDKNSSSKYLPLVNDLFLIASKVLVGMQGLTLESLQLVDSVLFAITQACLLCFVKQNSAPAGDVLLIISDSKKSLFYEESSMKEEMVVTVTNPAGTSKGFLDPIKQIPEEFPSLCQADLMMSEAIADNNYMVVKRENVREGYLKIAELIIKRLEGCEKQFKGRTPEWLNKYLEIIVKVMRVMTTQYLIEIFKLIREKLWQYYTQADQNVIRNITKELLESMFLTVEQIFIRLDIEEDKNKWLEHFVAEITLPLIRCQLLKKKSIGTKYLSDICNQVYNTRTKYLRDSDFKVWIANNKVFEELFTLDTHDQIMEAGGDILKYIVRTNSMTNEQLYTILNIIEKGDANLRRILSKIMYDLTLRYDYNQTEIILNEFKKYPPGIFNEQMIKIISDTSRYSIQRHKAMGILIFEKLITQHYQYFKPAIQEELFSKYIELMKCILERSTTENNCLLYFKKLVDKPLETHIIQLLKKLLDLFPQSKQQTKFYQYNNTSYEIVKYLVQQERLHDRLLEIINSTVDQKRRQACLDFFVSIVKVYKDNNSLEDKYLSIDLLQQVTNYSKVFCQLLYSFRNEPFEQLYTILVSQPVKSMDHFICLKELFYYINKNNMLKVVSENTDSSYQVSVVPHDLSGFKDFLSATLESEMPAVREQAACFICQIYCNLSPELSEEKDKIIKQFVEQLLISIHTSYDNKQEKKVLGYLCLLEGMMNQTETKGVGTLIAHSSLVNIESVKITITNEITYGYGIQRNYESKFPSNLTLFEMLVEVGKVFKCSPQDIIIKYNDQEIKSIYNGLSLHQLNLKDKVLNAHKRTRESIPKAQLLDFYNRLTEAAIKVFTSIYYKFAPNGQMTQNDAAKFVQASTNDSCSIQDYRVLDLFLKYDTNKDGILEIEGFLSFFEDSCKSRESTVWRNLESLRIRPDLKRYEDVKESLDYNIMARYIIYESDIYDVLFELTLIPQLKQKAIQLLKRLPTSKKIIKQTLENIKFGDKDEFMSWYKLTLIEWMIHQNIDNKQQTKKNQILNEEAKNDQGDKSPKKSEKQNTQQFWVNEEIEMKEIKFAKSESSKSKKNENEVEFQAQNSPDIAHIDSNTINEWKERFLSNKMYLQVHQQAQSIAETKLKYMSSTNKTCLLLCLQIIRRLCKVPDLQKPLPSNMDQTPEIKLVDLPSNKLSEALIPQLFENEMNTQLLEPLLCLLFDNKKIELNLIYPGLFYPQKEVRIITNNFLYLYQRLNDFCIDVFVIEPKQQCEEFFAIVNKILVEDDKINLQEVFNKTYTEIEQHVVKEYIGSKQPDYLFEGKLSILNTILVVLPQLHLTPAIQAILIQKLHQTLFTNTRQTLYNLLLKTDVTGLFKYLCSFIDLVQPKKPSTIRNNFVGLYNLGCICYMNSMLQQFYMTPQFRYAILGVENLNPIPISEKKGKKFKDNILYQLQRMFAFLELSQRGDYSPEPFCYSYKSDINVGIQEDSQQFLGAVFTRIQTQLKNTHFNDLVDKVYGGKTIMTIKCSKCSKERYRVEDFNNLQLEVKQRKNVDESLARFSEEQTINDFKCEFCQQEGIIRSTSLYQLPNVLIIHLMRMVFDVETYERIKLHNKLQFPTELNLLKYMKVQEGENLPTFDECQYNLKGVVIHSGCAESGHYYSLIKDKNDWYKFDDSRVTNFNINQMPDEAFGGREEYNDWGCTGSTRSKNAYMLIYEKKIKSDWIIKKQMTEEEKQRMSTIVEMQEIVPNIQSTDIPEQKQIRIKKFNTLIRRDLEEDIIKDHKVMFHQLQFYQDGFFKFLKNVIQKTFIKKQFFDEIISKEAKAYTQQPEVMSTQENEQYLQLLQFLLRLMEFFTKTPNPDINIVKTMIPYIDLLLFILPEQAENFIMNFDIPKHFEVMLTHSDSPIRDLHRSILNRCFNIVLQKRDVQLNDINDQSIYKLRLIKILEDLLGLLYTQVPKNSSKVHQYFQFWRIFSLSTRQCMKYCFNKNFISLFIDFLLQKKSPIMLNPGNYTLSKYVNPPIESLLQMLAAFLVHSTSHPDQLEDDEQNRIIYVLTENDKKCLTHIPFYKMMIDQKQDFTGLILILNQLVHNNFNFSLEVAIFLMKGINKSERYQSALAYMMIINDYLAVEDQCQRHRLEWILGVPQLIQSSPNQYSIKYSIRNQTVRYLSSIFAGQDNIKSVLELLYSQRRNPDSFSVTGVSILLNLLSNSKAILEYVLSLPPPCYFYGSYVDWIPLFVDSFQKDRIIVLPDDKDKIADKCFTNLIEIQKGMEKMIAEIKDKEMAENLMREEEEAERQKWEDDDEFNKNEFYDEAKYRQEEKTNEVEQQNKQRQQHQKLEHTQLDTQDHRKEQAGPVEQQKIQIPLESNQQDKQDEEDIELIQLHHAAQLKDTPEKFSHQLSFPNEQEGLYEPSPVVIQTSDNSSYPPNYDYLLPTAEIPSNSTILPSLYPLYILGVSQRTQVIGTFNVEEGEKEVKLTELVISTYIVQSKPTGDDNLSLPKDLFEHQSNFKLKPLKYFVDSDTQYISSFADTNLPQVKPTVVQIKIQTNSSILVTSKNPNFKYSFYYTEGNHILNLPYLPKQIDQLIEISFTNYCTEQEVERREEGTQSALPYMGPLSKDQYENNGISLGHWDQNDFLKEVVCNACTFLNAKGAISCELCQTALDFM